MAQISARRLALNALRTWRDKREFGDSIFASLSRRSGLQSSDKAFALELFYGVLRNLILLDFWIDQLRSGRIDLELRDLLRLGIYQILIADVAAHAAVNETVAVAPTSKRAITNAVLRSAVRRKDELRKLTATQPLEIRASHRAFLVARWHQQFGTDAAESLCQWNNQPPPVYVRINRLKTDVDSFALPKTRRVETMPNFLQVESLPTEALKQGRCYVQDPSTAIACEMLRPQPGEKVLDACAAPGGKTSYIAELMQDRGILVACDRDPQRIKVLKENLSSLGVQIAKVITHDWTRSSIPRRITEAAPFDRILLDAPCSNTGVMRRRVDVRWRLQTSDFERMEKKQLEIARVVLPLLKPSGVFVYSTCSLEREENDTVVEELLRKIPTLRLEEKKSSLPFRDGFDGAFAARIRNDG